MLMALCIVGMLASVLLIFNVWPRGILALFPLLSFIRQRRAGFFQLPVRWDAARGRISYLSSSPLRASDRDGESIRPVTCESISLQWEWFRIYFESGLVKLVSGDPEWRHLTAMDEYYQNGPLPTWIGWYLQHLPHGFHWTSALANPGDGTGAGLHDVSAPAIQNHLFLHHYRVANLRHSHCELHLLELPRAVSGISVSSTTPSSHRFSEEGFDRGAIAR